MRIYYSYPMTGQPDSGLTRGKMVAAKLREFYPDHEFIVPHEIMHGGLTHDNPYYTHADYVREDIRLGLSSCTGIALDEGWPESDGCMKEFQYAVIMRQRIFFILPNLLVLAAMDGKGELQ